MCIYKIRQTGRNYKNKPKITYLLIAANFFLLFSLYYCIFCCCLSIDPSVGRHLCFERDKLKRYRGTKNDITGHIVFMSPCYRPDKGTSM